MDFSSTTANKVFKRAEYQCCRIASRYILQICIKGKALKGEKSVAGAVFLFISFLSVCLTVCSSLPQISLFCIIYWTPTVKKHTSSSSYRGAELRCTDTLIYLDRLQDAEAEKHTHTTGHFTGMMSSPVLGEGSHGMLTSHSCKTNQTDRCLLCDAQIPALCTSWRTGLTLFMAAVRGLQNIYTRTCIFPI